MFIQLGNTIYDRIYTPSSWSVQGDEAAYAEHDLINSKPRIEKTGQGLQEQSFSLKLRVEYCNPANALQGLKSSMTNGEVLPLLLGNGNYIGDFVIQSMPYTIEKAFPDGTIIEANVTLTLKEFVSFSKEELAQQEARKKAFAVGTKKPVVTRPPQPPTDYATTASKVTEATEQTNKIDGLVSEYMNNVSKRDALTKDITVAGNKALNALDECQNLIQQSSKIQAIATELVAAADNTKSMIASVISILPPTNPNDLSDANNYLQSSVSSLNTAAINLFIPVAIRRDNNSK